MILYRPVDGDVHMAAVTYRPQTFFLLTQLGNPLPARVRGIREEAEEILNNSGIQLIDATAEVTGKDFLHKIWTLLISVPAGLAIIDRVMSKSTYANIFYELGILQALGKETLIIKTKGTPVPSDFVRTEYVEYDGSFRRKLEAFLRSVRRFAQYHEHLSDELQNNPLLAIDYLRRAFLLTGNTELRARAQHLLKQMNLQGRASNSVEMLLANF